MNRGDCLNAKGDEMGFFKTAGMTIHANSIASKLEAIRKDHFETIVLNIEQVLGRKVAPEKRGLSGRAEIALMGFQLFNFIRFMRAKSYVSERDDQQVFCGLLIQAAWMPQRKAVDEFCVELNKCGDDFPRQAAYVAVPVSLFVLGEPNPIACRVIGTLLPGLGIGTQLAIANEYGDKRTEERLREDLVGFQKYIENI
jgi:hypothetical protein